MIPTAILEVSSLARGVRWCGVPIVALGWAGVIAFADPSSVLGAALLGVVNGAVGVAFVLVAHRVTY